MGRNGKNSNPKVFRVRYRVIGTGALSHKQDKGGRSDVKSCKITARSSKDAPGKVRTKHISIVSVVEIKR